MLSMLPFRASAAGAQEQALLLVQGGLSVSVPMMMMLRHCSAGWRKVSLQRLRPLRTSMVVFVLPPADLL
jgi:hypothetical protein